MLRLRVSMPVASSPKEKEYQPGTRQLDSSEADWPSW